MQEITSKDFANVTATGVVLVDFSAEWCGPCKVMLPMLDKLAGEYSGRVSIYTVDTDKSPELATTQGIMGMPTFLLFKNGKVVDRASGAMQERALRAKLDAQL